MKKILITGGAGFVGSNLGVLLREHFPGVSVTAFDNLKRRGSELALARLREHSIRFVHGDIRVREDLEEVGPIDTIIDCAAEPSVLAGVGGSPDYVIQTNLTGTINALELARRNGATLIFLSTSRVYPVAPLNALSFVERETRFELADKQTIPGASSRGIAEDFPLEGARSIYGASKLSAELLIHEYIDTYGIQAVIDRCGVLTGPWQMGKVDQGVIVLWVAKHIFKGALSYIGYGGSGKQVRDILHVRDLFELLKIQLAEPPRFNGGVYNVGGGNEISVSLLELTELCREATGEQIPISAVKEDRPNDLRSYISDCSKIVAATGWAPRIGPAEIIGEIARWIRDNRVALEPVLGG